MEGQYDVYLGSSIIGTVTMERQGLYWHIRCRCKQLGAAIYKLRLNCASEAIHLGILVPEGNSFVLETRLPAKRLLEGKIAFTVMPHQGEERGKFIPIYPEEPFAYLEKLKSAYLRNRNGVQGIIIPEDQKASSKPTGQWSDPKISE